MKHINNYEHFINEYYSPNDDTRSNPLASDKPVLEIIKDKAPWYLENIKDITPIYRGLSGNKYRDRDDKLYKSLLIDPSKHKRIARNTDNYYINILDNSPYWKGYPKRSESIICSTDYNRASAYGAVYRVIPLEEDSKCVVCPESDVFQSFPVLFDNLNKLNSNKQINSIASFNGWLGRAFDLDYDDSNNHEHFRKTITDTIRKIQELNSNDFNPNHFEWDIINLATKIVKDKLRFNDFYNQLDEWMDPNINGFKLINYNRDTKIDHGHEIYTDSNCLLVLNSDLEDTSLMFPPYLSSRL